MAETAYAPDPRPVPYTYVASIGLGTSSGGSSAASRQVHEGLAPAAPTNTSIAHISFDSGGGAMQEWVPSLGAWA